jgi:UDP-glucose 4-epimerase
MPNIFVTGGAGYIGSHTCVELLQAGHRVTVYDNLSNSHPRALDRIVKITGKKINFIKGDIRDASALRSALRVSQPEAVIHFAGLKAVGESVAQPMRYYDNNVIGTMRLLESMQIQGVKTIVFSSSATVYGEPQGLPIPETHPLSSTSPYGKTKLVVEDILRDLQNSDPSWRVGILRYFNPIGAHTSGLIGEDPKGTPNNLLPYITRVAVGKLEFLSIFGSDYKTRDGTGVRDYIHVVDLALGHLAALKKLSEGPQLFAANLGTGVGYSVLDIVKAFKQTTKKKIPYKFAPRRDGDVDSCYADPSLASSMLGWTATKTLENMCQDSWNWQSNNPDGYLTEL